MDHAFFDGYDWEALVNYALVPPWIPKLQDHKDASAFAGAARQLDLPLQAGVDPKVHDKYTHAWDSFGAMQTGTPFVAPGCAPMPEPHSASGPEPHRAFDCESAAPLIW